mmetsp:Transcript_35977/g.90869  ORF Transcript_35977/g.90869 Transcript_35977/m.90869 type:complete len:259 (-) Transcript_35977:384-1160(-)
MMPSSLSLQQPRCSAPRWPSTCMPPPSRRAPCCHHTGPQAGPGMTSGWAESSTHASAPWTSRSSASCTRASSAGRSSTWAWRTSSGPAWGASPTPWCWSTCSSCTTWPTRCGTRPPSSPPWTSPRTALASCCPSATWPGCPSCSPRARATSCSCRRTCPCGAWRWCWASRRWATGCSGAPTGKRTSSGATPRTRPWLTSRRCPPRGAPSSSSAAGGARRGTSTTLVTGSWGCRGACLAAWWGCSRSSPTSTASILPHS